MSEFTYNESDKALTCVISGKLDTIASIPVQNELNIELAKYRLPGEALLPIRIIFDFSQANFISSTFIRICLSTAKQVSPGSFSIIHCDPFLKKTFKIAGLDEILNVS